MYAALVNTADPRIGLITVGEVLTKEQADALGAEKLQELVARGVLSALGESKPAAKTTEKPAAVQHAAQDEEDEEDDYADDEEEELDALDVIVDEEPKKPARKAVRAR